MAEDKPSFIVDDDWKRQAQEEKRRLEEEERKRREAQQAAPAAVAAPAAAPETAETPGARGKGRKTRELGPASFQTLVNTVMTQAMYYLGGLSSRGGESLFDMDMARHQLDTLAMLEEKTRGNLNAEEQEFFDLATYEVRMRFISVASQIIAGPGR